MINDKTAIINAAQKYAAKGHVDKAIAEWQKLLDERKDGNIQNTIGDLYLKKGSEQEAVESFTKAADLFKKDGFYPKAIAIYKKVLNIVPNDVDALIASAKLNANRGLMGNAIDNYYRAAEIYNKDGSAEKANMIVEKILQLEPSDVNTRSKIAHLYSRIGLKERASNEYSSIARDYLKKNDNEKAREYFNKALEYDPASTEASTGLSALAQKEGNIDQAFTYLDSALSVDPGNLDVLLAYSKLAIDSGRKDDAKRSLAILTEMDPSNIEAKKLLAAFFIEEGLHENAWEELEPLIDDAVDAEQWSAAQDMLNIFDGHDSISIKQCELRISKARGDRLSIANTLRDLAGLYVNEDSSENALLMYKELLDISPGDAAAVEKVRELETALGIEQPVMEARTEEHRTIPEENADTLPAYNEISFPEPETAPETHMQKSDVPAALNEFDIHEISPAEPLPDEQPVIIDENITDPPEAIMEETSVPSEGTMSAEEFTALKAEADFYADQGLIDEAGKIYKDLLSASPGNNEIQNKLNSLNPDTARADEISLEIVQDVEPLSPSGAECDESVAEDPFTPPGTEFENVSEAAVFTPPATGFEEVREAETFPPPASESGEVREQTPATQSSVHDDLTALFNQFEPQKETIDYEASYTAGLDLKQQGLFDEAIKKLEIAADDPDHKLRNATMLALCFMEAGKYPSAIEEFNKILDSMMPEDSTYLHVKYELASAHMKNMDHDRAVELFSEVQAQNREFKDVSAKLESLQARSAPNQQSEHKPKRDRVSYI